MSNDNNSSVTKLLEFLNKKQKKITYSFNKVRCSKEFTTSQKNITSIMNI